MWINRQKKHKISMGLAFNEDKEMQMLAEMAKKGWLFYKYSGLGYDFKKGEPQDLSYCVDMHDLAGEDREQYLALFAEAGWTHVCSVGNMFHYFSAVPGTKPIYTDRVTLAEKYLEGKKGVLRGIKWLVAIFIISLVLHVVSNKYWDDGIIEFINYLITGGSFGLLVGLTATVFMLDRRIKKLT